MRPIQIILVTAAITLAAVGALLVVSGIYLINDSNAKVQRENSLGCNGANCTTLSPGIVQPEGLAGVAFIQFGEFLMVGAAGVCILAALLALVSRHPGARLR